MAAILATACGLSGRHFLSRSFLQFFSFIYCKVYSSCIFSLTPNRADETKCKFRGNLGNSSISRKVPRFFSPKKEKLNFSRKSLRASFHDRDKLPKPDGTATMLRVKSRDEGVEKNTVRRERERKGMA